MGHASRTRSPFYPSPWVLVVDDAGEVRNYYAHWLQLSGMEVLTAANGRMALDAGEQAIPDVIVTDVDVSVRNGLDFCRHLRADAAVRNVGVVGVTGRAHVEEAIDAGSLCALRNTKRQRARDVAES